MPLYYVNSGELCMKIEANTPQNACLKAAKKAIEQNGISKLGYIMLVDERGYNRIEDDTQIASTFMILKKLKVHDQWTQKSFKEIISEYLRNNGLEDA